MKDIDHAATCSQFGVLGSEAAEDGDGDIKQRFAAMNVSRNPVT